MKINQIYQGDCLELMKQIEDNSIDLIVTDPPYKLTSRGSSGSMGGEFWKSERAKKGDLFDGSNPSIDIWLNDAYRILKDGTHIYIMTNDKNLIECLLAVKNSQFKFIKSLIWVKPNKICGRWYMTQKETVILARKGKQRPINNASSSDVLTTPNFKKTKDKNGNNIHDTEKPVELYQMFIENSSNKNDIVLDIFAGSFPLGIAAIRTGRNFLGMEKDEGYYKIGNDRVQRELAQTRMDI